MKQKKIKSIQEWNPIEKIQNNGTIILKNKSLIKIIKINSINYSLKTEFEKETILNSYKILLKTCNFPIQIIIQSTKEDLTNQEKEIKEINEKESEKIKKISQKYLKYLKELNNQKKSSRKNFFIIINSELENIDMQEDELSEKYMKIKECLSRCGNSVNEISEKKEILSILKTFLCQRNFYYINE